MKIDSLLNLLLGSARLNASLVPLATCRSCYPKIIELEFHLLFEVQMNELNCQQSLYLLILYFELFLNLL